MITDLAAMINHITIYLDRSVFDGKWFLSGEALAHFVCSGSMEKCKIIEVSTVDVWSKKLRERADLFGLTTTELSSDAFDIIFGDKVVRVLSYAAGKKGWLLNSFGPSKIRPEWVTCDDPESFRRKHADMGGNGLWRRQLSQEAPLALNLPFQYGTILDHTLPTWFRDTPKRPWPTSGDVFYTPERAKNGKVLIAGLYGAAEKAGFRDRLFAGFGTLLGYLMYGTFIPKDRDIDMCILTEGLPIDAIAKYASIARGLDPYDKRAKNDDPFRWEVANRTDWEVPTWFSVGYLDPTKDDGTKSCNWFFFDWNGFLWHSKGKRWVDPGKINHENARYSESDDAVALGIESWRIPALVNCNFDGLDILIPTLPGSCCDWWYPGWCPEGKGASAHRTVCVIPKWGDKQTWRMV